MKNDPIRIWRHESDSTLGFMDTLGQSVSALEARHPGALPDLRDAQTLLLGTDFSGSHKAARFQVSTYLIANLENIAEWDNRRTLVRGSTSLRNRRMSFKDLNDVFRRDALIPFLWTATRIPGLLFTVAVDKRVQSLFVRTGKLNRDAIEASELNDWKMRTAEKALQAIHMASLLVRGLSGEGQDVLWIIDEDDVVANETRHRQFVNTFATVSAAYLKHELRHLRIVTTKSDTGRLDLEDFVAICDLVSGSVQELLQNLQEKTLFPTAEEFFPRIDLRADKAQPVLNWLSDHRNLLKQVNIVIDEEPESRKLRATNFRLIGADGL